MDRKTARALAQTALEGLNVFEAVLLGAPTLFGGRSPVAVITSRSLQLQGADEVARGLYTITNGITVSIYVRRDDDGSATEDQLDDLALQCALALHATHVFDLAESSAGPENGNLRDVDQNKIIYRIERIPLTVLDEGSD